MIDGLLVVGCVVCLVACWSLVVVLVIIGLLIVVDHWLFLVD